MISCLHGNMEALEAVADDIRRQKPDQTICLGDLVGYGPYPNEVVSFIERNNIPSVMGCWDEGISMERDDCGCKFVTEEDAEFGHQAFAWTKSKLTKKNKNFLKELSFGVNLQDAFGKEIVFVHGSPRSTSEYLMESTHDLVLFERAAGGGADILICGHTHVPFVREIEGELTVRVPAGSLKEKVEQDMGKAPKTAPRKIQLNAKLVINAGSVGEPRDGRPESSYVLFDTLTHQVEIRRVAYDVQKTVQALRKQSLPEAFASRLLQGVELAEKKKDISCAC